MQGFFFFRYDELSNIAPEHLGFFPDHLRVFVPRVKNDIYREGNYVYIKRLAIVSIARLRFYRGIFPWVTLNFPVRLPFSVQ